MFRASNGRTKGLTGYAPTAKRISELVKRRLKDARLPTRLSPHRSGFAALTDLLSQRVPMEDVHYLTRHTEPQTTELYNRRRKRVTRDVVERILS